MLDLKFIRDNKDAVKEAVKNRGLKLDIDELIKLDEELLREARADEVAATV